MKFSTRHDTDLSADALFAAVTTFPKLERILLRRGAKVRRTDNLPQPSVGNSWDIAFDWRGKARDMQLAVSELAAPERLAFSGASDQFNLTIKLTIVALTRSKSRVIFEVDVQPRGMKARLLLQTAKLGKTQLDKKFAERAVDLIDKMAAGVA